MAVDEQYLRLQRMQLHDISEDEPVSKHISPRETLSNLTQHVPNEELKQAIRGEIKKLVTDYDRLILIMQQRSEILEQEFENLQMTEDSYQRRYEKAVREMQFYKKKYDKIAELNKQHGRPRSPSMESSGSSLLDKLPTSPPPSSVSGSEGTHPLYQLSPPPPPPPLPTSPLPQLDKNRHLSRSSSSSTSSSNASGTPYWSGFNSELSPPPPVPRLRQNSNNGNGANSIYSSSTEGDKNSFLQGRKGSWQQMQAGQAPVIPTVTRSTTISQPHNQNQVIQQRRVDPIAFGGSDAFWETIAKSKTNDSTIEKMISNFLRRGGSPNTAKQCSSYKLVKYGYGLLHTLVAIKAPISMDLLLSHGANPNAMTLSQAEDDKVTPGYLAASLGWLPGLQTLVEAGTDICQARGAGLKNKTALHVAAEHCHTPIVEYIVSITPPKYHAQVDSMGASALHYAAISGHSDLVLFLIQNCRLAVDLADIRAETPLHWASRYGQLEVASLLIERFGCDYNSYIPRKVGTPYDLAKAGGHKRLMEYYKKIGALTSKKMDKKKEEDLARNVPVHLESALSKNGLFGF